MVGQYILFLFTITTLRAQQSEPPPKVARTKLEWQDGQIPHLFSPQTETNKERVSKRYIPTESLPIWESKNPELKIPGFLFTENGNTSPLWSVNSANYNLKSPEFIIRALSTKDIDDLKSFKNNDNVKQKHVEVKRPDPNNVVDLYKKVFEQKKSNIDEEFIKKKIFTLARETERELAEKIKIIEKTNSMLKHNNFYKLGFIVSYINTTYNTLTDLMRHVGRNQKAWDIIKILNAYAQIKKTKEFLLEMLSILNHLQSRQSLAQPPGRPWTLENKKTLTSAIAWSYYDDAM